MEEGPRAVDRESGCSPRVKSKFEKGRRAGVIRRLVTRAERGGSELDWAVGDPTTDGLGLKIIGGLEGSWVLDQVGDKEGWLESVDRPNKGENNTGGKLQRWKVVAQRKNDQKKRKKRKI